MTRVIRFHELGGPEVLRIDEVDVLAPREGEVRIRVKALGLNRAEALLRSGTYIETAVLPSGLGLEAAGVVESVGGGVTGFAVGDAVSLGVRAEHFGLAGAGNVDIALDVDVAEHLGSTSYVYANASGESLVIEREESRHENGNERITVSISAARAYLFDSTGKRLR